MYQQYSGQTSCEECAKGKYLDLIRNNHPDDCKNCPAGTYSITKGLIRYELCIKCSSGKFSQVPGSNSAGYCFECDPGKYNNEIGCPHSIPFSVQYPDGTTHRCNNACQSCTKGKWSDTSGANVESTCIHCSAGKFQDLTARISESACKDCPKGRFGLNEGVALQRNNAEDEASLTLEEQKKTWCMGCGPGQYLDEQGSTTIAFCKDCVVGKFLDTHNDERDVFNIALTDCKNCPKGRYGDELASTQNGQEEWDVQKSSGKHERYCKACKAGTYNDDQGQSNKNACVPCTEGKFSSGTSVTEISDCISCPRGYYGTEKGLQTAQKGQGTCIYREPGEVGETLCTVHSECKKISLFSLTSPFEAEPKCVQKSSANGIELTSGSKFCIKCGIGFYNNFFGRTRISDCSPCPAGKYTDQLATESQISQGTATHCKDCPLGFWTNENQRTKISDCKTCPKGTYGYRKGADKEEDCGLCPSGFYQNELKKLEMSVTERTSCKRCTKGRYGPLTKGISLDTACKLCTKGKYQNLLSQFEELACKSCLKGSYNDEEGSTSINDCIGCPTGRFGNRKGLINDGNNLLLDTTVRCVFCPTGYYQNEVGREDSSTCKSATPGKYVPEEEAIASINCVVGKYSGSEADTCILCPKGYFQPNIKGIDCKLGTKGFYISNKGQDHQDACVVGKYGIDDRTECLACPKGWWQGNEARMKCIGVSTGHFAATAMSSKQIKCPAGWYGLSQADKSFCKKCAAGRWSETQGLAAGSECQDCSPGRYNNEKGVHSWTLCKLCVAGKFGDIPGLQSINSCKDCSAGKFQGRAGMSSCIACQYGKNQPNSTALACIACQVGTYQDKEGSTSCTNCNTGYFQEFIASTDCDLCEPGFYQGQTAQTNCTYCPMGFYSECKGRNDCLKCEAGQTTYEIDRPFRKCRAKQLATVQPVFYKKIGFNVTDKAGQRVCLAWYVPESPDEALLPSIFDSSWLQWSFESNFEDEKTNTSVLMGNATKACVNIKIPVHMDVVFFRVRGKIGDALGTPSAITDRYDTGPSCGDVMYLCVTCRPPVGRTGLWTVGGAYNPNPMEWRCMPCPSGADCRGPKIWDEVYAKYGYVRLGKEDYEDRKDAFWPCFKQLACLGGERKFDDVIPGTKHGYWIRPYILARNTWNIKSCNYNEDCIQFVEKHPPRVPENQILKRPNSDCCSSVNDLEEEGGKLECLKNPNQFQSRFIDPGSLFVDNLDWDTTSSEIMELFKKYKPQSASIKMTIPNENLKARIPLGWATVYFNDKLSAKFAAESVQHSSWNFSLGFNIQKRGCWIDMAIVDDYEQCHVGAGFARNCSSPSGKCRLCRSCAKGYWAQGVSNCYECPSIVLNVVLVVLCIGFVLTMLMTFLSGALADSGAEADSTVVHLSQAQQKILLNHIQLISLASGFPLKWPDVVQNMFEIFSMFGNAGSYVFNPSCNEMELVEGEKPFFQKTLGIAVLPFIAVSIGALFWLTVAIRDFIDPPEKRTARYMLLLNKKKDKIALHHKQLHQKRYQKIEMKRLKKRNNGSAQVHQHAMDEIRNEMQNTPDPNNNLEQEYQKTSEMQNTPDPNNNLEQEYQKTSVLSPIKETPETASIKKMEETENDMPLRKRSLREMHREDANEIKIDGNNERVEVIRLLFYPLVPLGILWEATSKPIRKRNSKVKIGTKNILGTLEQKYVAKIKKITNKDHQAGIAGLQKGDILQSMRGEQVVSMTLKEMKVMLKAYTKLGDPFTCIFVRKLHTLKERIQNEVKQKMGANKSSITTWDKFVATTITMLYLLYPTVTRAAFTLVACQKIGSRLYLQMDLDVVCYDEEHLTWVYNCFIPSLLGYIIGMPLMTLVILYPRRHDLHNRWTKFRFGVLFTGYSDKAWYWESVIAARKAAVITVSVFFTTAGPEAQALCAVLIIMAGTVLHLIFRPFRQVSKTRNTLFWSEFWGLQTAFITFWTGLFFFQPIAADNEALQIFFTVELLFFNFIFLLAGIRWYCILKLMDVTDMINTKLLQGVPIDMLYFEISLKNRLKCIFPEWTEVKNLWSRKGELLVCSGFILFCF